MEDNVMKHHIPDLGLGPSIQNKIKYFACFEPYDNYGGTFTNVEILRLAEHPRVCNTFGQCARLEYIRGQAKNGHVYSTAFYFRIKKEK
jgi:hypothetical protein